MKGEFNHVPVQVWAQAGDEGGALALFDVGNSSTALVLRGGPNVLALMPVLATLRPAGDHR